MLNRKNQTAKCYNRVSFGKTTKMPLGARTLTRSTSCSLKKQSRLSCKDHAAPQCNLLAKTFKKGQMPAGSSSLKGRFDELVNELFLKIDFDCSGYVTFTKIGYCKEIPERLFYFFGGVFQKVKQLGGVAFKMFTKLCEEAYRHANLQDIESILPSPNDH
jgi:hypothetical protein